MFAPHKWNVRCLIRCLRVVSWEGTFNFSGSWSLASQTERRSNAGWRRVAGRATNAVNTHEPPPQSPHSVCPDKACCIQLKATIAVWQCMTSDKITEELWNMNDPHTNYCGIKWKPSCDTIHLENTQLTACFLTSLGKHRLLICGGAKIGLILYTTWLMP